MTAEKREFQGPLIIKGERNRDWREESRKLRRKNLLPAKVQAQQNGQNGGIGVAHVERIEASKTSGIQFVPKDTNSKTRMSNSTGATDKHPLAPTPKTADEEAMDALVSGEKKAFVTIPALDASQIDIDTNDYDQDELPDDTDENTRFRDDVSSRPDVATLEDYAAVPVEGYGSALLRGYGWEEGKKIGKQHYGTSSTPEKRNPRIVERRPALLGIGAKEVPGGVGDEIGSWGKVARGKRKSELTYTPVVMRNSVTGETLSEADLKAKIEDQKERERGDDWRDRRDRNLRVDAERKGERMAIEDGRNRDGRNIRSRSRDSSRRDRSREKREKRKRSQEKEKRRERSRSQEGRPENISREKGHSRHGSSRRRSRSSERSRRHGSLRTEKSYSSEYRQR